MPRPPDLSPDMTLKEKRFILFYLGEARGSTAKAAQMAGYGSTYGSASMLGYRLMRKARIRKAIEKYIDQYVLSAAMILRELTDQGTIGHVIESDCMEDEEGTLEVNGATVVVKTGRRVFNREKAKELGVMHLVKCVKRNSFGDHVEVYDRQEALKMMGNYRGIFAEKIRVDVVEDLSKLSMDQLRKLAESPN
jgi:hypothetical protein